MNIYTYLWAFKPLSSCLCLSTNSLIEPSSIEYSSCARHYSKLGAHQQRIVKVKVTRLCPSLCDRMDYRVHVILQARIREWVAFPFSRGLSHPRDQTPHCRWTLYQLSHREALSRRYTLLKFFVFLKFALVLSRSVLSASL